MSGRVDRAVLLCEKYLRRVQTHNCCYSVSIFAFVFVNVFAGIRPGARMRSLPLNLQQKFLQIEIIIHLTEKLDMSAC